jgi:phosphoglucomutase
MPSDLRLRCRSHNHGLANPKEYNGYKVSWNDGGTVVSPHDKGIIDEVRSIKSVSEIASGGNTEKIIMLGEETDKKVS